MTKDVAFSRFDAADHLKSEEDISAYLEAVMDEAEDDPAFITQALGTIARARNISKLAKEAGMTRQGLYKALSGNSDPSFASVMKIASALHLKVSFEVAVEAKAIASKENKIGFKKVMPRGKSAKTITAKSSPKAVAKSARKPSITTRNKATRRSLKAALSG